MLGFSARCFWLLASWVAVTLAASQPQHVNFSDPAPFRYEWQAATHRLPYDTKTFIARYLDTEVTDVIYMRQVSRCATACEQEPGCNFFEMVEVVKANPVCALYKTDQAASAATVQDKPAKEGHTTGTVRWSFGFARDTRPPPFKAPSHYKYAWTEPARLPERAHFIRKQSFAKSSKVTQTHVDECAALCSKEKQCRMINVVQYKKDDVTCALFNRQLSSGRATDHADDKVVVSYQYLPVLAAATTSRTMTTKTTTTKASATSTKAAVPGRTNFPPSPTGARLVRYKGCSTTGHTIPMMVNKNYPIGRSAVSQAETVWLVQHGSKRDFDDAFNALYRIVGDEGVIISPNFYAAGDTDDAKTWYDAKNTLAWDSNDWFNGADAILPAGTGACSSFDIIDSLIADLRDAKRYPNLKRIISVAHSGGSSMMARYGMLSANTDIKYVLANAPAMPYFTTDRPLPPQDCKYFMAWGYGFTYSLPRYVAAKNPSALSAFKKWIQLDVTLMTGTYDTYSRDSTGDQSCYAVCEGGANRRDRGYAYWAYLNLLANTSTDVSAFYGYKALKKSVSPLKPAPRFTLRHCVVPEVAHYNHGMYSSKCGVAAIHNKATLPPSPPPSRPA